MSDSASFVDMMTIEQSGEKLRLFQEGPTRRSSVTCSPRNKPRSRKDPLCRRSRTKPSPREPYSASPMSRRAGRWSPRRFRTRRASRNSPDHCSKPCCCTGCRRKLMANGVTSELAAWQAVDFILARQRPVKEKVDVTKVFPTIISTTSTNSREKNQEQATQAR